MKIFYIYTSTRNSEDIKIIESGSSIYAGIFNVFWALYHGMYYIVAGLFLSYLILDLAGLGHLIKIIEVIQMSAFFIFTDELHRLNMRIKKYNLTDVIYSESQDSAMYKFVQKNEKVSYGI